LTLLISAPWQGVGGVLNFADRTLEVDDAELEFEVNQIELGVHFCNGLGVAQPAQQTCAGVS
jgi:hypothetical protein